MSDDYHAFCERKARQYAELEAEEKEMWPEPPTPQPQQPALTDAQTARAWDAWVKAHIASALEDFAAM